MILHQLFPATFHLNEAYALDYIDKSGDRWEARFESPSRTFNVTISSIGDVQFTGGGSYSQQHGTPQRELAHINGTIFKILADYAEEVQPEQITFSAAGRERHPDTGEQEWSSRPGAYAASSNKMSKQLYKKQQDGEDVKPYDVTFTGNPPNVTTYFTLRRVDDNRPPKLLVPSTEEVIDDDGNEQTVSRPWREGDMPKKPNPEQKADLERRKKLGKRKAKLRNMVNTGVTQEFIDEFDTLPEDEQDDIIRLFTQEARSISTKQLLPKIAPRGVDLKSFANALPRIVTFKHDIENALDDDDRSPGAMLVRWIYRNHESSYELISPILNNSEKAEKYIHSFDRLKKIKDAIDENNGVTQEIVDSAVSDEQVRADLLTMIEFYKRKGKSTPFLMGWFLTDDTNINYSDAYYQLMIDNLPVDGTNSTNLDTSSSDASTVLKRIDGFSGSEAWVERILNANRDDHEDPRGYFIDGRVAPGQGDDMDRRIQQNVKNAMDQNSPEDIGEYIIAQGLGPERMPAVFRGASENGAKWWDLTPPYKRNLFKVLWGKEEYRPALSQVIEKWRSEAGLEPSTEEIVDVIFGRETSPAPTDTPRRASDLSSTVVEFIDLANTDDLSSYNFSQLLRSLTSPDFDSDAIESIYENVSSDVFKKLVTSAPLSSSAVHELTQIVGENNHDMLKAILDVNPNASGVLDPYDYYSNDNYERIMDEAGGSGVMDILMPLLMEPLQRGASFSDIQDSWIIDFGEMGDDLDPNVKNAITGVLQEYKSQMPTPPWDQDNNDEEPPEHDSTSSNDTQDGDSYSSVDQIINTLTNDRDYAGVLRKLIDENALSSISQIWDRLGEHVVGRLVTSLPLNDEQMIEIRDAIDDADEGGSDYASDMLQAMRNVSNSSSNEPSVGDDEVVTPTSNNQGFTPDIKEEIIDHVRGLVGIQGNFGSYEDDWARIIGDDEPITVTHQNGDTSYLVTEINDGKLEVTLAEKDARDHTAWEASARQFRTRLERTGYTKTDGNTYEISIEDAIGGPINTPNVDNDHVDTSNVDESDIAQRLGADTISWVSSLTLDDPVEDAFEAIDFFKEEESREVTFNDGNSAVIEGSMYEYTGTSIEVHLDITAIDEESNVGTKFLAHKLISNNGFTKLNEDESDDIYNVKLGKVYQ